MCGLCDFGKWRRCSNKTEESVPTLSLESWRFIALGLIGLFVLRFVWSIYNG